MVLQVNELLEEGRVYDLYGQHNARHTARGVIVSRGKQQRKRPCNLEPTSPHRCWTPGVIANPQRYLPT